MAGTGWAARHWLGERGLTIMLRLLFCTAAIFPIAIIPWMTSEADTLPVQVEDATYAALVTDPSLNALSLCEMGELPVFFHDAFVTTHSVEFIAEGLQSTEGCGSVDVTIIPILPEYADEADFESSALRATELTAYVQAVAEITDTPIAIEIANQPVKDDISTLYINGRAAILRITPQSAIG